MAMMMLAANATVTICHSQPAISRPSFARRMSSLAQLAELSLFRQIGSRTALLSWTRVTIPEVSAIMSSPHSLIGSAP